LVQTEWFKAFQESISNFYFLEKWFLKKFILLPGLPTEQWKQNIIQLLFNHIVKSSENCWVIKLRLGHMLCEIFKEKKNSIHSELPKTSMFSKRVFKALGVKIFISMICTLNRDFKGTKKLKGRIVENCRCFKRDVQPPDTSVTIDV